MTIPLNSKNRMLPSTKTNLRLMADLSALEGLGYTLVPIDSVQILNADPHAAHPDPPLRFLADQGVYDAVVSGSDTQLVFGSYPRPPHGPVLRNGRLDTEGNGRSNFRGTVAVLTDGTVVMGRADGTSRDDLALRFDQRNNPVKDALGGGALLIERGARVGHLDLLQVQLIGSGPDGMKARCMRHDVHTLMGIHKGQAYAGWCIGKSAFDIQSDFYAFEFGTLIKFAYGSAVFFDDCIDRMNGNNGTGFGIRRAY